MNKKLLYVGGVVALLASLVLFENEGPVTERLTPEQEISFRKAGEEIKSLRKSNRQVFKAHNGQLTTRIYTIDKLYFDAKDSAYKKTDLTVYEISDLAKLNPFRTHDKYVDAGPYTATWFDDKPYDYTFLKNGKKVKYTALFDTIGITIETKPIFTGIKQNIILRDSTASTELFWLIETDANVKKENNELVFRDLKETIVFKMSAFQIWDADDKIIRCTTSFDNDTLKVNILLPENVTYPIAVDPTTTTISSYVAESVRRSVAGTYAENRDNDTGSNGHTGTYFYVGQYYDDAPVENAQIDRAFFAFEIPNLASVSACTLYCNGYSDVSTNDFDIYIHGANEARPEITGDRADYSHFHGRQTGQVHNGTVLNNTWNSSSYSSGWNKFIFNSSGIDSVVNAASDTLWLCMISREDYDNSQPAVETGEFLYFEGLSENAPYLALTYTVIPNKPTDFAVEDSTYTSLTFAWADNSDDEDGFFIKNVSDTTTVKSVAANTESVTVTGLDTDTEYQFFIVAYHSGGESEYSVNVTARTKFAYNYSYIDTLDLSDFLTHKVSAEAFTSARSIANYDSVISADIDTLGQRLRGSGYDLFRSSFEVYDIPRMNAVSAGTLMVYLVSDNSVTDFNIQLYKGLWAEADSAGARFYSFDGWQSGNTPFTATCLIEPWNTTSFSAGILKLPLNPEGFNAAISASQDTLRVVIVSSRDSSATEPTSTEYIVLNNSTSSLKLVWALNDSLPADFTMTPVSPDSIIATWRDRTESETGFRLVNAADTTLVAGTDTTEANVDSMGVGGLSVNTIYSWMIQIVGGDYTDSLSAPDSKYTLANVPGKTSLFFSGGDVFDESGSANHGINNGARIERNVQSAGNDAYYFNGSSNYIDAGDVYNGLKSIAFRVKIDTTTVELLDLDSGTHTIEVTGGTVSATGFSSPATYIDGTVSSAIDTAWHHVTIITSTGINAHTVTIGKTGSDYLRGFMDDIRAYSRVLSANEADSLSQGLPISADSLKLHYTFDLPDSTMKFVIDTNNNPSYTKFAIQDSVSGWHIDASAEPETLRPGTLGEWGWKTHSQWGTVAGDTLEGIIPDSLYVVKVKARNGN
ncbi:MAG: hypothetical protein HOC71_02055 [Candidatus Latescibacteria bacterium]|jgi:hypothetical protein|nr:hypothetical protein [Candidatus Latescibacterota bacterium]